MFCVQSIPDQIFSNSLERLDRGNGLTRSHHVRPVAAQNEGTGVEARSTHQREEALRAYRRMTPADLDRGPLYHADQVMSGPVIVLAQDSTVADAWRILHNNRIHQAPVVDDEGKLIGLVSERDLLTAVDVENGQVVAARQRQVRDLMTTPVIAASPMTDIRRIASVMLDRGVDGVPVIAETGRLTGFVSRSDILRAVVADPPLSLWR